MTRFLQGLNWKILLPKTPDSNVRKFYLLNTLIINISGRIAG